MGCSTKLVPRLIAIVALALLCAPLYSQAQSTALNRTPGRIIAVIPEDFPPTYFKNQQTGRADGFAVDLMNEIARRSGLKVEYVFGKPWDEIQEMLVSGRADVIPNMTMHAERQKRFAFTEPVGTNPVNIIILSYNSKVTGIMPGITIGVIRDSSAEDYLKKDKTVRVKSFSDMHSLLFELLSGRIDAAMTATQNFMHTAYEARVDDKVKVLSPPVIEGKRAMAVRKNDVVLLGILNRSIDKFVGTAEYQTIYQKWYGKPVPFWTVEKVVYGSGAAILLLFVGMALWRYLSIVRLNSSLKSSIGERIQAEAALRESEALQRQLLANLPAGVVIVDPQTRMIELANDHVAALFGAPVEGLLGRRCHALLCPASEGACPICDLGQVVETSDREMLRADGSRLPILKTVKRIMLDGSEKLLECFVDITDRKKAEMMLSESEARFRDLLQDVQNVAIQGYGPDGTTQYWNYASERLYGYSAQEAVGRNLVDLIIPPVMRDEVSGAIRQMAETGQPIPASELSLLRKDGSRVSVFSSHAVVNVPGRPPELFCIDIDLSEQKQAEEEKLRLAQQLQQAQKMEAIGQLAGGVAHDFNNILQAISGFGHLLHAHLKENPAALQYVSNIMLAAERAATLTRSLLAFSRKQLANPQPISLNATIKNTEKILASLIGEDIRLSLQLTEENTATFADSGHVTQILMNLAVNARDAMPGGGGLKLATERVFVDEDFTKEHGYGTIGNYILITVTDMGTGMDEETRKRIFEPFFTTKEVGKGTGLGLSMVYGIVKQHNGFIDGYSEVGQGTVFKVYLPAFDEQAEACENNEHFQPEGTTGTILVAEDNRMVRQALAEILGSAGYAVVEAVDGDDAVAKYREHKDKIQLVLMDLIMPGRSGIDAWRELRSEQPDIKLIFMSGYTGDYMTGNLGFEKDMPFISKPVSPKELFSIIRNVLSGGTT